MSMEYLHAIRDFELDVALAHFPPASLNPRVVDVGAGTGRQAARLAELGFDVVAIDLPSSAYAHERVYAVVDYNGIQLPFCSGSIDVIYSSNVLEHIDDHEAFFSECRRVLASDGVAIHVLPTSSWRVWTSVAHYPWIIKRVLEIGSGRRRGGGASGGAGGGGSSMFARVLSDLLPSRHGERGNVVSEVYYFSERWWRRRFEANGFEVLACGSGGLFYTGAALLGLSIPMRLRSRLARLLGPSCKVYVTRRSPMQREGS